MLPFRTRHTQRFAFTSVFCPLGALEHGSVRSIVEEVQEREDELWGVGEEDEEGDVVKGCRESSVGKRDQGVCVEGAEAQAAE